MKSSAPLGIIHYMGRLLSGKTAAKLSVAVLLLLTGVMASSCGEERGRPVSLYPMEKASLVATAERNVEPLRIAVAGMISPRETLDVYGDIITYLGQKLSRPTQLVQRTTYADVNRLVQNGEVDLAFVCSQAYVEGHRDFGMELLVAPQVEGETIYYSYIIVPRDSPVFTFDQLRGGSFAFVDPLSNTGRLVPVYLMAQMDETPDSFFGSYVYTRSHSNSIKWVALKMVDGAAVDSLVWDYAAATDPTFTSKTRIVYTSPPYGIPPVVVGPELNPALKRRLRDILLTMHKDPEGQEIIHMLRIDRFVPLDDAAYDSIQEMLRFLQAGQGRSPR